ncbi:hypothetical protein [Cellulomonas sp. P5_C5]
MTTRRYFSAPDAESAIAVAAGLLPRGAVVDIEPLVRPWGALGAVGTDRITWVYRELQARGPVEVTFATNGRHTTAADATVPWRYVTRAHKPWTRRGLLPRRVDVVVGDTALTDGLLAARLGACFVHLRGAPGRPWWPTVQAFAGAPLVWWWRTWDGSSARRA